MKHLIELLSGAGSGFVLGSIFGVAVRHFLGKLFGQAAAKVNP